MHRSHNIVKTDEIIGQEVCNEQNEKLGKIREITLEKQSGNVAYIALETSGFLGMGGKMYALPWNSIHYDVNKEKFITSISKKNLKRSASFDKGNWPEKPEINLGSQDVRSQ